LGNVFADLQEFRLLRACATSRPDPLQIKNAAKTGVNWPKVLELAEYHNVRPLLWQSLRIARCDHVPDTIMAKLERFSTLNTQRNLAFAAELIRLAKIFERHGVPIATFKGVALAEAIYGDLSLREVSDLDLIVPETATCQAERMLTSCGYVPILPDRNYRSAFQRYQGQYGFRHAQTYLTVDLHWRFSSVGIPFALGSTEIWNRLGHVSLCGQTVPTLARDDLALFLAAHGAKDGWTRLKWLVDFAVYICGNQDIQWEAIMRRAQHAHASRAVLLAVLLASDLLDAPVPTRVLARARADKAVCSLAEAALERMLKNMPFLEFGDFLGALKSYDRLRDRLLSCVTLLTTRTAADYQAMPLPKSLWGIYYATRPFRLVLKAARMLLAAQKYRVHES
jgi:hypothetical protein